MAKKTLENQLFANNRKLSTDESTRDKSKEVSCIEQGKGDNVKSKCTDEGNDQTELCEKKNRGECERKANDLYEFCPDRKKMEVTQECTDEGNDAKRICLNKCATFGATKEKDCNRRNKEQRKCTAVGTKKSCLKECKENGNKQKESCLERFNCEKTGENARNKCMTKNSKKLDAISDTCENERDDQKIICTKKKREECEKKGNDKALACKCKGKGNKNGGDCVVVTIAGGEQTCREQLPLGECSWIEESVDNDTIKCSYFAALYGNETKVNKACCRGDCYPTKESPCQCGNKCNEK